MRAFLRRRGRLLLQLGLVVAAIALIAWRLDVGEAFERFREAEFRWIPIALVLFGVSRVLYAYRWRLFMPDHPGLPLRSLTGILLLSNMVNMLVPARAGDVLRVELSHRRLDIDRSELASNVVATETIVDASAFVLVMLVLLPFMDIPLLGTFEAAVLAGGVSAGLVATLALARVDADRDFERVRPIRWLPERVRGRVAGWVPGIVHGVGSLRSSKRLGSVMGISVVMRLIEAGAYWMIGLAFALPLAPHAYVAIMVVIGAVVTMPVFPSNIGPFEVAVAELADLLGADRGDASAYAIGTHVLLILWAVGSGLVAMWLMRLRPRDLT